MKKRILKNCAWTIGMLIGAICLGTIFMILAYLFPVNKMRQNANESISMLLEEGDYYKWISKDITSQSDGFTDALMINTATYEGEGSIVEKALLNPRADYLSEDSQTQILANSLDGIEQDRGKTYGRYWHGYIVILKPLLVLFNYSRIRWINTFVSCVLIALILLGFYKRFANYKYAICFMGAIIFLNPIVMRISLQFNTVFYVIMVEYIVALYFGKQLEEKGYFKYLFLLSGILVSFLDLLTYPIAAMGMLCVLQLLLFDDTLKNNIWRAVKGIVMWLVGYIGMWSGKWIIASLLTRENIIENAINSMLYRTGTSTGVEGWDFSWKGLFIGNSNWIFGENAILFKMFIIIFFATVVFLIISKKVVIRLNRQFIITMLFFCFIPIGRYVVVSNHSFIHSFFTYRECIVAIMAIMCTIVNSIEVNSSLQ